MPFKAFYNEISESRVVNVDTVNYILTSLCALRMANWWYTSEPLEVTIETKYEYLSYRDTKIRLLKKNKSV
jgi:hypothetical protein